MKRKVLLIEDKTKFSEPMREMLEDYDIEVLLAETISEALALIERVGTFDAIIIDGCIEGEGNSFDCPPLIEYILKKGITKILVAASTNEMLCDEMIGLGCTHSGRGNKSRAVNVVTSLFKRMPVA